MFSFENTDLRTGHCFDRGAEHEGAGGFTDPTPFCLQQISRQALVVESGMMNAKSGAAGTTGITGVWHEQAWY